MEIYGAKWWKLKIYEIFKYNGNFKVFLVEMLFQNILRFYCSFYFVIIKQMYVIDLERLFYKILISDIKVLFRLL